MSQSYLPPDISHLSRDQRITLVEQIWDSIAAERETYPLTPAQEAELDRRLAEHEASPDDVVSWEEI